MKLVIEIDKEIVESVKYGNVYIAGTRSNGKTILCKITDAIANATPLTDCTDAISREEVTHFVKEFVNNEYVTKEDCEFVDLIVDGVNHLPSVNPSRPRAIDEVLSQIQSEIHSLPITTVGDADGYGCYVLEYDVNKIIDKYKGGDSDA